MTKMTSHVMVFDKKWLLMSFAAGCILTYVLFAGNSNAPAVKAAKKGSTLSTKTVANGAVADNANLSSTLTGRMSRLIASVQDSIAEMSKSTYEKIDSVGKQLAKGKQDDLVPDLAEVEGLYDRETLPSSSPNKTCLGHKSGIAIFVYTSNDGMHKTNYENSIATQKCYAERWNYTYIVQLHNSQEMQDFGCNAGHLLFRKHCSVRMTLMKHPEIKWLFVLDADTGVANPDHCLEEWVDDSVDIQFHERFFLWEPSAGNYAVKNTNYSHYILDEWVKFQSKLSPRGYQSWDNAALLTLLMEQVFKDEPKLVEECHKIWFSGQYYAYVFCADRYLRTRARSQHIRLLRRAHSWVMDRHILHDHWSVHNFMMHGWKRDQTKNYVDWSLLRAPKDEECSYKVKAPWPLKKDKFMTEDQMRTLLVNEELGRQRTLRLANSPDIRECWPHCESNKTEHLAAQKFKHG